MRRSPKFLQILGALLYRCGAKTRAGKRCQAPAMPNGRCRLHGGLSTGPKTAGGKERIRKALTKHGRYSAATKLQRKRYRQVLLGPHFKGKLDLLDSLREPEEPENSPETERGSPLPAAVDNGTALSGLDSSRPEPGHGLSVNLELTDVAALGLDKGI